jgi:hypothetical protein
MKTRKLTGNEVKAVSGDRLCSRMLSVVTLLGRTSKTTKESELKARILFAKLNRKLLKNYMGLLIFCDL